MKPLNLNKTDQSAPLSPRSDSSKTDLRRSNSAQAPVPALSMNTTTETEVWDSKTCLELIQRKMPFSFESSLTSLNLGQANVNNTGAMQIAYALKGNSTLTELYLKGQKIKDLGISYVLNALQPNRVVKIFGLEGVPLSDHVALELSFFLKMSPSINTLTLVKNHLSEVGFGHIADHVEKSNTLVSFVIADNKLGDPAGLKIAKILKSNSTLTRINLDGVKLTDVSFIAIAESLKVNKTLKLLSVADNQCTDVGLVEFSQTLASNNYISELNLANNKLTEKGASYIANVLFTNTTLKYLDLSGNSFKDTGAFYISGTLKLNTTLTYLSLSDTQMEKCKTLIVDIINHNHVLKTLDLSENKIDDKSVPEIITALRTNTSLMTLNMCANQIADNGAQLILDYMHTFKATLLFNGNPLITDQNILSKIGNNNNESSNTPHSKSSQSSLENDNISSLKSPRFRKTSSPKAISHAFQKNLQKIQDKSDDIGKEMQKKIKNLARRSTKGEKPTSKEELDTNSLIASPSSTSLTQSPSSSSLPTVTGSPNHSKSNLLEKSPSQIPTLSTSSQGSDSTAETSEEGTPKSNRRRWSVGASGMSGKDTMKKKVKPIVVATKKLGRTVRRSMRVSPQDLENESEDSIGFASFEDLYNDVVEKVTTFARTCNDLTDLPVSDEKILLLDTTKNKIAATINDYYQGDPQFFVIETKVDEFVISVNIVIDLARQYSTPTAENKKNVFKNVNYVRKRLNAVTTNVKLLIQALEQKRQSSVPTSSLSSIPPFESGESSNGEGASMREKAYAELVSTEQTYGEGLERCISLWCRPLLASNLKIDKKKEFLSLLQGVETIFNLHTFILEELKKHSEDIGRVFLKIVDTTKLYIDFVNKFDLASTVFVDLEADKHFVAIEQKGWEATGKRLRDYLITPIQRLPRYQITLETILNYTAQDHPDFSYLETALEKMKSINIYINEKKRDYEHRMQLLELTQTISNLPSYIIVPHRICKYHGDLDFSKEPDKQKRKAHLFLMNDLIIIALWSEDEKKFKYEDKMALNEISVSTGPGQFSFTSGITWTFYPPENTAEKWNSVLDQIFKTHQLNMLLDSIGANNVTGGDMGTTSPPPPSDLPPPRLPSSPPPSPLTWAQRPEPASPGITSSSSSSSSSSLPPPLPPSGPPKPSH
eukprot:TRINITY_DN2199_c0_g2_i2.p1 TRINITY_DN2199_c0_g2~~TRINITY_DN2199_c0_g2_i2.p1  ORF type:complete len:1168 (-),score=315.14 TRINITY_DN2199_c0_g2_i2:335-3838(-)